jgi:hypothetical protein
MAGADIVTAAAAIASVELYSGGRMLAPASVQVTPRNLKGAPVAASSRKLVR